MFRDSTNNLLRTAIIGMNLLLLLSLSSAQIASQEKRPTPQMVLLAGHEMVEAIAFSHDGKTLASAGFCRGDDGRQLLSSLFFWDSRTKELKATLAVPQKRVKALAFSPSGKYLAAGCVDHSILLWDAGNHKLLQTFTGHKGSVQALAFAPDGQTLVSGDDRGSLRLWDLQTGKAKPVPFRVPEGAITVLSYSANGKVFAVNSRPFRQSLGRMAAFSVFDVQTGKLLQSFDGAAGLSPDGESVAVYNENGLQLMDVKTAKKLRQVMKPMKDSFDSFFQGLTVAPDGKSVALNFSRPTRRLSGGVVLVDVKTGETKSEIGWQDGAKSIAFSPDGDYLAFANAGMVRLHNVRDNENVVLSRPSVDTIDVTFSPDGKALATTHNDGGIRIWNPQTGKLQEIISESGKQAIFSPNGKTLAISGGLPGTLRVWDLDNKKMLWTQQAKDKARIEQAAFSPDGKLLVSIDSKRRMDVWEAGTGKALKRELNAGMNASTLVFAPDGKFLVTAGGSGQKSSIHIWDTQTWKIQRTMQPHEGYRLPVAFSPDDKILATGGEYDRLVKLWDTTTWKEIRQLDQQATFVRGLEFSHDGKQLAVLSYYTSSELTLWDVSTGKLLHKLPQNGRHMAKALAFSPKGNLLVTGETRSRLRVWDSATGKLLATLKILPARKTTEPSERWIAFTPTGYYTSSPEAEPFLLWQQDGDLLPAERLAKKFHQPELVQKALAANP